MHISKPLLLSTSLFVLITMGCEGEATLRVVKGGGETNTGGELGAGGTQPQPSTMRPSDEPAPQDEPRPSGGAGGEPEAGGASGGDGGAGGEPVDPLRPPDEGPVCGDGQCVDGEDCGGCPEDCGACGPVCGDDLCDGGEDCGSCAEDCGVCPPECGDGQCNGAEDCQSCPGDCGECAPMCGDGQCNGDETCQSCPGDCGVCPPECGDGQCNGDETCDSCVQDCGACGWPEDLARTEEEVLQLVNAQRAQGANCGGQEMPPTHPLTMNAELREAARLHSLDMAQNNYFDHTGLNGSSFSQRASAAGYRGFPGGENIAAGSSTAQGTFNQWLNSPGHCVNMMRDRFREIGIGHAYDRAGQYGHYWTQVFGM